MTLRSLNILITGGGTGGHLFPGIAIAESFVARNPENSILFVNTCRPVDRSVLSTAGFRLLCITAEGIKGRAIWSKMRAVFKIPLGLFESIRIMRSYKPDIVIGVGSYSSGPVIISAWLMGIPTVLHEQNIIPGITNRVLSRFAKRVYVSFEKTGSALNPKKIRVTGNPVRKDILNIPAVTEPSKADDVTVRKPFTILILGGSQGAHSINMAVIDAFKVIKNKKNCVFIHQTGAADEEMVKNTYEVNGVSGDVKAFFTDMARQYRKADLIICRAGATTIAEVTATGKCAIFVPFPFAADNHQVLNARTLVDEGAAQMILDDELNGPLLADKIDAFYSNRDALNIMAGRSKQLGRPDAADKIVDDCFKLLESAGHIKTGHFKKGQMAL